MKSTLLFALGLSVLFNAVGLAETRYRLTDIGTLGGSVGVSGVNDRGEVTGTSYLPNGDERAFVYRNGAMTAIGTFGGAYSIGYDINNSGQAVGTACTPNGEHAYVYSATGTMTDLGAMGGTGSVAMAINNKGWIAGGVFDASGLRACVYRDGVKTDLSGLMRNGYSNGLGINESGQVVGSVTGWTSGYTRGFLYSNGTVTDLGTFGGLESKAFGINSNGLVVGMADKANGATAAYLYSGGVKTDLGTLYNFNGSAYAHAINDGGDIVGGSQVSVFSYRAFLYTGGKMLDLNNLVGMPSGWTLSSASDISNSGMICGTMTNGSISHGFLLTPVPEPATLALLGLGGMAVAAKRRRSEK